MGGFFVYELVRLAVTAVGDVVTFLLRFVAGRQLFGRSTTNATFFRRATRHSATANPSRWALAPGYVRSGVRVGTLVVLYGWWQHRTLTLVAGAVVVATAGVLAWRRHRAAVYERDVLAPVFDGLAPLLHLSGDEPAREWLAIPRDLEDADSTVVVGLPRTLEANDKQLQAVTAVLNRRLPGGPWEPHPHFAEFVIEYRPAPAAPTSVRYDEAPDRPLEIIPIAQTIRGSRWIEIELAALTPHVLMSATTGWGKTSTALVMIGHTAGRGALVDILDPKRIGYLDAFRGIPHIRIHTDIDNMVNALHEFLTEMRRRYQLIEHLVITTGASTEEIRRRFQPRILVEDEKGSLTVAIKQWWKSQGEKGDPAPLDWEREILWQGRAARMYVFSYAQQANLNVLKDSDMRDQYGFRIAAGPQSPSAWRMLFGGPRGRITKKKGRAFVAIGYDDPEAVHLAWQDPGPAREMAEAGAELALAWAAADPAADTPFDPAAFDPDDVSQRAPVPLVPDARRAADTAPDVLGQGTASEGAQRPTEGRADGRPNLRVVDPDADPESIWTGATTAPAPVVDPDLVIGLAAAAELLELDFEAFRKARQREDGHRIPGETRVGSQPAFPRLALLSWQSKRPIAGRRPESDETERKAT